MKKKLFQFLLLLPVLNYAQNNAALNTHKKYTVPQLQTDLIILKEALVKAHPGLLWYQTENQFKEHYTHLYDSLKAPMSEVDFYKILKPFINDIKCGHTNILFSNLTANYYKENIKYLPFAIKIINHKVYIAESFTAHENIVPGTEIISINGRAAERILKEMMPYSTKEGLNSEAAMFSLTNMFKFLLVFLYDEPDIYNLELTTPTGEKLQPAIPALKNTVIEAIKKERNAIKNIGVHSPFRFKLLDSLNTAILTINNFEEKGFSKFLKRSFKAIKQQQCENLIIDLRHNFGGDDEYGSLLFSYIAENKFNYYDHLEMTVDDPDDTIFKYGKLPDFVKKAFRSNQLKEKEGGFYDLKKSLHPNLQHSPFNPKGNGFRKKVYILIGQDCFSTTTEFCAIAHFTKRATFIGQETGGCYCGNCSYEMFELILPNTGLIVYIPLVRYYMAINSCPHGRGIQPDYKIEQSIENFIKGKDAEMDFALDLIRKGDVK